MAFDPDTKTDFHRLTEAVERDFRKLLPWRQERIIGLREYVGKHYGSSGAEHEVIVNHILQGVLRSWRGIRDIRDLKTCQSYLLKSCTVSPVDEESHILSRSFRAKVTAVSACLLDADHSF